MGDLLRKLLAYVPSSFHPSRQSGSMSSYSDQPHQNYAPSYQNHDQQYQAHGPYQNNNDQYQDGVPSQSNQRYQNPIQVQQSPPPNHPISTQQGPRTLIFKKSIVDTYTDMITIYASNSPPNSPPLYTIKSAIASKPTITFFRGNQDPRNILGTSIIHSISSKQDLVWHGQAMQMKTSSLSGNSTLYFPGFGKLKWVVSQLGGSSLELRDEAGTRLAKYNSVSFMGDKKLETFVPGDEAFVELVVLSAMTCAALTKVERKVASEVAGAA